MSSVLDCNTILLNIVMCFILLLSQNKTEQINHENKLQRRLVALKLISRQQVDLFCLWCQIAPTPKLDKLVSSNWVNYTWDECAISVNLFTFDKLSDDNCDLDIEKQSWMLLFYNTNILISWLYWVHECMNPMYDRQVVLRLRLITAVDMLQLTWSSWQRNEQ